jgi:hypothetical protein
VKVQQQALTLTAAEQLLSNDRQQLDVGRLPPIEVALFSGGPSRMAKHWPS